MTTFYTDQTASDSSTWESDVLLCDVAGDWQMLADRQCRDGLLRVRQKAMRADAINGNDRLYPQAVVQAAIERARRRAEAGAMLCDMLHPDVAEVRDEEFYVDHPDRKTARVDAISDVGPD